MWKTYPDVSLKEILFGFCAESSWKSSKVFFCPEPGLEKGLVAIHFRSPFLRPLERWFRTSGLWRACSSSVDVSLSEGRRRTSFRPRKERRRPEGFGPRTSRGSGGTWSSSSLSSTRTCDPLTDRSTYKERLRFSTLKSKWAGIDGFRAGLRRDEVDETAAFSRLFRGGFSGTLETWVWAVKKVVSEGDSGRVRNSGARASSSSLVWEGSELGI